MENCSSKSRVSNFTPAGLRGAWRQAERSGSSANPSAHPNTPACATRQQFGCISDKNGLGQHKTEKLSDIPPHLLGHIL